MPPEAKPTVTAPACGAIVRVGGDTEVQVQGANGAYRSGACSIDTSLPDGYPAPTPPGAIDIKTYPVVRLAEVTGAGNPDSGKNRTFWPLFNHIQQHGIPMTSPVEMNYRGMTPDKPATDSWTMAFLYRSPDVHQTGNEGRVVVRDAEPVTVVAVGMKGDYSMDNMREGMGIIERWLGENPQWKPAGDWRSLYYNGPTLFYWNKWAEIQLPVRPAEGV